MSRPIGFNHTSQTKEKIGLANNGTKNGMWKEKVSYKGLHRWVRRNLIKIKPLMCENCKTTKNVDCANKSNKYLRDLSDWKWLCRKCHMLEDNRIKNLKQYSKGGEAYGQDYQVL